MADERAADPVTGAGEGGMAPCCDLTIGVRNAPGGPERTYTLSCTPPSGTHFDPEGAVALLHSDADPFAALPRDSMFAQVFVGPEEARVEGRRLNRPVATTFRRNNAGEAARWERAVPVLPPTGAA